MRKFRHLTLVVVLVFAFASSGFAGIIPTVPEPEPPPSSPGITDTPLQSEFARTDPTIEFALTILQSVLMAF